jgi:hypothetical protein
MPKFRVFATRTETYLVDAPSAEAAGLQVETELYPPDSFSEPRVTEVHQIGRTRAERLAANPSPSEHPSTLHE